VEASAEGQAGWAGLFEARAGTGSDLGKVVGGTYNRRMNEARYGTS
jgi:hypothetical protein